MLPTVEESRGYDFQDPENAEKWRGLFVNSLRKVLEQTHGSLSADAAALQYVEGLCLRLLGMLCAAPSPLTVQDVEERVARTFPTPLDKWALADARDAVAQRRRRALALPADRLHQLLQKEVLLYKLDAAVAVFMAAVIEYVSADILKLAGNFVKKISQKSGYETITCSDIKTAMCADKVLMDMFYQESEPPAAEGAERRGRRGSLSYGELVRDLVADERHFLRDLHLIIRVFKEELEKILDKDSPSISLIFGNIVDIYELTTTLLGNLEDAMEMSQDSPTPYIGSCFEELAEVEEFRAYVRYANVVTRKESRDELQRVVDDPILSERLVTAGHGFRLAVKYYLPKLLLAPVAHVFLYHNYVLALLQIAPASDDRESFKQVECNLHPIKKLLVKALGNGPKMDATLRMAARARRQLAIEKCNELARIVENWDTRDIGQCCSEFIREDTLSKVGPGRRVAERRAYLFDGLLLLCKPLAGLGALGAGGGGPLGGAQGPAHQLKLKEKLHVRKLELVDRPDTDECRHAVELTPRVGGSVVVACGSAQEKRHWMCDLVMLNTKPMLDRILDSILLDLERRHPLRLPPASLYRFAVPDSPDNIVLEQPPPEHAPPLIKGATLLKLVERLTYHVYADLKLVRTFLTTYRSFCSPTELLDLLIERFDIPEPSEVYDAPRTGEGGVCGAEGGVSGVGGAGGAEPDKLSKSSAREDWKRYRKKFQQPVKFRVINVIRHWVDQHFYDFERDPELLQKLRHFLESVDGKPMRKWVQSVLKTLHRKSEPRMEGEGVSHVFSRPPPPVLRHVHPDPSRVQHHPLALHPLELARQLTLLEFALYRTVRPSELVGAVWTKRDKETTSPNLLKIIKHTTNFTRWMEKWIVESENLEERVGVVCRLLETAVALRDLNNFNGVLAVVAATGSAAVHRLKATFQLVPYRLARALDEFRELNSDHFRRYQERLRSINPPCVPFFGMYLTNILHIEEGNLDYLPNSELINFSKRRKVAEITGEIQQYQNQPYCLTVEPKTRAFLESLDPFPGMDDNEITNYLYAKSLEIEPRQPVKQMPKFPRKYPELSLKPVKVSRRAHLDSAAGSVGAAGSAAGAASDDNISVSQLSPTAGGGWEAASGSSCSAPADGSALSPRTMRDKSRSSREEPPSPRDRHSPRHDSLPGAPPSRPPTLSPRSAIVDAELFYSRSGDRPRRSSHAAHTERAAHAEHAERTDTDRGPPLLPRAASHHAPAWSPPSPPARPPPSPKHVDATSRMPALSPKRSPAPAPPAPPAGAAHPGGAALPGGPTPPAPPTHSHSPSLHNCDRGMAFSFPVAGAPAPSPPALPPAPPPPPPAVPPAAPLPPPHTPAPPLTPHPACVASSSSSATPPPLPPRRRRDSAAPHTPTHLAASAVAGSGSSGASPGGGVSGASGVSGVSGLPPPLPPRPAAAPALLRPAQSAILQRRQTAAPRLPPKPAAGARS